MTNNSDNSNNINNGNQFNAGSGTINIGTFNNIKSNDSSLEESLESNTIGPWKEDVYDLVTRGLLKDALALIAKSSDNKLLVVQILSRIHKLEENTIAGIINKSEEGLEHNNIVQAILLLTSKS